jgi:hypothetical protein
MFIYNLCLKRFLKKLTNILLLSLKHTTTATLNICFCKHVISGLFSRRNTNWKRKKVLHFKLMCLDSKVQQNFNFRSLFIRIDDYSDRLGLSGNLSRILYNQLAFKLPATGWSTVQCYGLQNFKSSVVERLRRRYLLWIVTAELRTANAANFQRKIQLSGLPTNPDDPPSQLIRISGVLLYKFYVRFSV